MIVFVIQMYYHRNKRSLVSTANEAMVGILITIGNVNDVYIDHDFF